MSFFNKKEEVYHIELTPYGRYLLSIGKLKPHHYRFFDDDVAYDSDFISKTETQNETHKRILDEIERYFDLEKMVYFYLYQKIVQLCLLFLE